MRILFPIMVLSILMVSVGIFSTSMNFVYSQTTTEEKKVELLTSKIKEGEYSTKFIGQVQNMLTENVEFVKIIATFYDQSGNMIGSKSTYAEPYDLQPKMKAPFEMYLDDDVRDSSKFLRCHNNMAETGRYRRFF